MRKSASGPGKVVRSLHNSQWPPESNQQSSWACLKEEERKSAKDTDYLCQPVDVESDNQQKLQGTGEPGNCDDPEKPGRTLKICYIGQLHKSIQLSPLCVSGRLFTCPGCSMSAHTYWHSRPAVSGGDRYAYLHSHPFLLELLLLLCSWSFNFSFNRSCGALKWLIIPLHGSLACSKIFHYSVHSGVARVAPLTLHCSPSMAISMDILAPTSLFGNIQRRKLRSISMSRQRELLSKLQLYFLSLKWLANELI